MAKPVAVSPYPLRRSAGIYEFSPRSELIERVGSHDIYEEGKIVGMTKPRPARKGCRSYLRHSAKGLLDE